MPAVPIHAQLVCMCHSVTLMHAETTDTLEHAASRVLHQVGTVMHLLSVSLYLCALMVPQAEAEESAGRRGVSAGGPAAAAIPS